MKKRITAIILAGGKGSRMGSKKPKQFLEIANKPIILYSLEIFDKCKDITDIVVVCYKAGINPLKSIIKKAGKINKKVKIVPGGKTRQESSFNGLQACSKNTEYVLIHDSARPFIDEKMIKRVLKATINSGAVTTVTNIIDTVVEVKGNRVKNILNRDDIKRVQTPQGFDYKLILSAHRSALKKGFSDATDDCSLVKLYGMDYMTVKGSEKNIKITTKNDLH